MTNIEIWQHYMQHFASKPLHTLTYKEFNVLAKKVAYYIKKEGVLNELESITNTTAK